MLIYNPKIFKLIDFICGEETRGYYDYMMSLSSYPDQLNVFGCCLDIKFCQNSLTIDNMRLINYVGYQ